MDIQKQRFDFRGRTFEVREPTGEDMLEVSSSKNVKTQQQFNIALSRRCLFVPDEDGPGFHRVLEMEFRALPAAVLTKAQKVLGKLTDDRTAEETRGDSIRALLDDPTLEESMPDSVREYLEGVLPVEGAPTGDAPLSVRSGRGPSD